MSAYGRSTYAKPGRPKLLKAPSGPICETCKCFRVDSDGDMQCAAGRILDPTNCTDYRSANKERDHVPGGITAQWPAR